MTLGEIPSILYLTGVSISMFACTKKTVLFNVLKKNFIKKDPLKIRDFHTFFFMDLLCSDQFFLFFLILGIFYSQNENLFSLILILRIGNFFQFSI